MITTPEFPNWAYLGQFFSIAPWTTILVESDSLIHLRFFLFKERKKLQIIYLISCVYFIIFTIGTHIYPHPNRLFCSISVCNSHLLLPESLPQMICQTISRVNNSSFLEIFLRIKKNILINQKQFTGTRWSNQGCLPIDLWRGRSPKEIL